MRWSDRHEGKHPQHDQDAVESGKEEKIHPALHTRERRQAKRRRERKVR